MIASDCSERFLITEQMKHFQQDQCHEMDLFMRNRCSQTLLGKGTVPGFYLDRITFVIFRI